MRIKLLAVLVVVVAGVSLAAQRQSTERVTFTETIAPILYANCVTCHRPGEAAPFSLLSYEDARKRGGLIAQVTKSRYMPPWHAVHGYGEFADERRLTDEQIAAIDDWVKNGMPQGNPARLPKVPQFTDGWQLGKPDLILEMPASFDVPASGPDIYRNFVIPTGLAEDKAVRAVEFRPGTRAVVHHALFMYVRGGALAAADGKDGRPGFGGAVPVTFMPALQPSGDLGSWTVGATPRFLTDGLALPLAKGSDLVLQLHLHPTGKAETERSTVGIYFTGTAAERKVFYPGTPALFGFLAGIDIPPGEKRYTINGTMTMAVDMRAYAIEAHAHYLGKEFKATATLPDGATRPLLWIQDWDFNWQDQYRFKEPLLLPKGTRIDVSITYDNSAENPRNPHNPPQHVEWGLESFDEMGIVRLQATTVNKEDEEVLRERVAAALRTILQQAAQDGKLKKYQERMQRKPGGAQER
jgi:mono/diheme cytochrome c family protein